MRRSVGGSGESLQGNVTHHCHGILRLGLTEGVRDPGASEVVRKAPRFWRGSFGGVQEASSCLFPHRSQCPRPPLACSLPLSVLTSHHHTGLEKVEVLCLRSGPSPACVSTETRALRRELALGQTLASSHVCQMTGCLSHGLWGKAKRLSEEPRLVASSPAPVTARTHAGSAGDLALSLVASHSPDCPLLTRVT